MTINGKNFIFICIAVFLYGYGKGAEYQRQKEEEREKIVKKTCKEIFNIFEEKEAE